VKCLESFSYYPAHLKDYDGTSQVLISYPGGWKSDEWVTLDRVRLAAQPHDPATFNPTQGETVEAQAKSNDDEPYSWWQATVKAVKGAWYLIAYTSWEDAYNEVLDKEMLRPENKNPPLRAADLHRLELPLPRDLRDLNVDHRQLNEMLDRSGCYAIQLDAAKQCIILVGSTVAVKRAKLLAGMAFKHLTEIARLRERTQRHQEHLASLKQRLNEGHLETFTVQPPDLIGLVIGQAGKNIRKAEKLPGILNVRVDSAKSQVSILAKSEAEAKAAREQLEFIERRYPIPRKQAGRVVGRAFTNMDQIQRDSGVVRIRLDNDKKSEKDATSTSSSTASSDDSTVDLVITGTNESVSNAILLLDHHMEFLNTLSSLSSDERSLTEELRRMNMEAGLLENEQRNMRSGRGQRGPRQQGARHYSNADFPPLTAHTPATSANTSTQGRKQALQQQKPSVSEVSASPTVVEPVAAATTAATADEDVESGRRERESGGPGTARQRGRRSDGQQRERRQGGQRRPRQAKQDQQAQQPSADQAAASPPPPPPVPTTDATVAAAATSSPVEGNESTPPSASAPTSTSTSTSTDSTNRQRGRGRGQGQGQGQGRTGGQRRDGRRGQNQNQNQNAQSSNVNDSANAAATVDAASGAAPISPSAAAAAPSPANASASTSPSTSLPSKSASASANQRRGQNRGRSRHHNDKAATGPANTTTAADSSASISASTSVSVSASASAPSPSASASPDTGRRGGVAGNRQRRERQPPSDPNTNSNANSTSNAAPAPAPSSSSPSAHPSNSNNAAAPTSSPSTSTSAASETKKNEATVAAAASSSA